MAGGNETADVEAWLYTTLSGDSAIAAIVGTNVFGYQLPQMDVFPCILFSLQAGGDNNTFGSRAMDSMLYLVKVVSQGGSFAGAGPLLARIDALLQGTVVTRGDGLRLRWRREQSSQYTEDDNGVRYNHAGGMYRCFASRL